MHDDFFTLEIGTMKTFETERRFVYFLEIIQAFAVAQKLIKHGKKLGKERQWDAISISTYCSAC